MKIAILTSSRADYGIYQPLLRRLDRDPFFDLELIVFGTHLSEFHGYTVDLITEDGYSIVKQVESLVLGDSEEAISSAMGLTIAKFSAVWASLKQRYDLLFCLGDRYEMFAAVAAAVPFNMPFAHIHGGEETRGAIDNIFRHSITQMASYHFTTTEQYKDRVLELISGGKSKPKVYNVGSLSLDNLQDIDLLNTEEFTETYGIDMSRPTILFTFHPETVNTEMNEKYIREIISALESASKYQIVITMPNADTKGNVIRNNLNRFIKENEGRVYGIENFGIKGYFSCMNHARFLMGNSSSGIIEAASFGKQVLNLGDRQSGRATGDNVLNLEINKDKILSAISEIEQSSYKQNGNIYWNGGAAERIIRILKQEFKHES